MPTIRDLNRVRQGTRGGTAVATVAITGNNLDPGTRAEPRFHSGGLPVGKQIDDLPPFEIADQRAVALSLPPCLVVDTHYVGGRDSRLGLRPNAAQERVFAVSLRGRPSDLGFAPMVSPTLCLTLSTALKSKFCLQPMVNAAGIGRMMINCALSRKASSATAKRQPQRGGMAFADHC